MASLDDLTRDLERALALGDPERISSVRRSIGDAHPETEAGAEANFRLALALLFREAKVDEAVERLRAVIKAKSPVLGAQARMTLGQILVRQGKPQQGLFELRKVATQKPATLAAAQAAGLLAIYEAELGNKKEAARNRENQLALLQGLAKSKDPAEAAMASFLLGLEHKFDGARQKAKEALDRALATGALPEETKAEAQAALKAL